MRYLLSPEDTVLVIVDIQDRLWSAMYNKDEIEKNALILIEMATRTGIPIVVTEQYKKGIGPTIKSLEERLPEGGGIEKHCFNCFHVDAFNEKLESLQKKTLLIAGMESHICVLQTALTARERTYRVHVVADATGSRTEKNHNIGLERMRDGGCTITSTEAAVFEVIKEAGSPLFKDMLKFIK